MYKEKVQGIVILYSICSPKLISHTFLLSLPGSKKLKMSIEDSIYYENRIKQSENNKVLKVNRKVDEELIQ